MTLQFMNKRFPYITQKTRFDCGTTCLLMIAKYHGIVLSYNRIQGNHREESSGVSLLRLADLAERSGFHTNGCMISVEYLKENNIAPMILHWRKSHFVVLYKVRRKRSGNVFYVADPARGMQKLSEHEFIRNWYIENSQHGIALFLEPDKEKSSENIDQDKKQSPIRIFGFLRPHKKLLRALFAGLIAGSAIQLALPFLTQAIVDTGIRQQDFSFIVLILIAQLALMASLSMVEIIRERILLHISTRINFSMLRDFLTKIMKLPVRLFDRGMTGDLLQRIADQTRVESFLTSGSIRVAFSTFNLLLFSLILSFYSLNIFLIFIFGSIFHLGWVMIFLKRRKNLDRHKFIQLSEHQTRVLEIIHGMKDIRMSGAEHQKRWMWEEVQAGLFRTNIKTLNVNQLQDAGSFIINQSKNIIITFLAANAVIHGDITLGMMLAIQFILGQANAPVEQMSYTIREFQDAFFSLERINDIFQMENEVADNQLYNPIPRNTEISFQKVSFRYNDQGKDALCEVSFKIPEGKTTALVGDSGCGKTTIINSILGVLTPTEGKILIHGTSLSLLNKDLWRKECGVVMQDGFVFNDTIAGNIALGHEEIDYQKIMTAIHTASLSKEMELFPSGVNTVVGEKGRGLSTGQKQRLLIARAIYKNPALFLFDEATNSLDANNEKNILNNLTSCLKNKTVIVAAHRLSTIINADQIIVLRNGKIAETGTHSDLLSRKGHYYNLIEKQSNTSIAS